MKIFIKNMVCNRCISAVQNIFDESGEALSSIQLGEVETQKILSEKDLENLEKRLKSSGFEILKDLSKKQIEKIKSLIIQKIAEEDISDNFILSEFLKSQMHKDYSAISKLFFSK